MMSKDEGKVKIFLAILDGYVYLIPEELSDEFHVTPWYERRSKYGNYVVGEDSVICDLYIDELELDAIMDGDYL